MAACTNQVCRLASYSVCLRFKVLAALQSVSLTFVTETRDKVMF